MSSEIVRALISLAIGLATAAVTSIVAVVISKIRERLDEKQRAIFDEIIKTVETVYRGMSSAEKREAFEALCKVKKVNVANGVKYLEEHIIPTSKSVNAMTQSNDERAKETD